MYVLKPSCHIRFPHVFRFFRSNNVLIHRYQQTKVSNKKTQRNGVNACGNGMGQRALINRQLLKNAILMTSSISFFLQASSHRDLPAQLLVVR